jgi:hypothetical protein
METKVQSIIFKKEFTSLKQARKWLKDHNFKDYGVDEKENTYRFRQIDPDELRKNGYTLFRTKKLDETISLIIAIKV